MLELSDLPINPTVFDLSQINKIKSNSDITLRVYSGEMHYTVKSINDDKTLTVTKPMVLMNTSIEDSFQDETLTLPESFFHVTPIGGVFEGFKSELIIIPVFNGEDLNIENPFIAEYHSAIMDEEYVIYEPETKAFLFYNPELEHCFKVYHNEKEFLFDSLDIALKFPFEMALKSDYKAPDSRRRLKALDEFLDSELGQDSMKDFAKNLDDQENKRNEFINSGRYSEMLTETERNFKLRNIEQVSSEDFLYLKELVAFIDEEEFHLMVDISLSNENVNTNDNIPFENYETKVKNLRFSRMIGQGTVEYISLEE